MTPQTYLGAVRAQTVAANAWLVGLITWLNTKSDRQRLKNSGTASETFAFANECMNTSDGGGGVVSAPLLK